LEFVHRHWREGKKVALRMGLQNGFYCLGCCWSLMLLLFVAGIMSLLWVAIASFLSLSKKFSSGKWIPYVAGLR